MATFTSAAGIGGILPEQYGQLIIEPLRQQSLALDPRVSTTVTTGSHEFHVPVVRQDLTAAWVAEGAEIDESDAGFDEIVVTPSKIAGLSFISSELAKDSNPDAQTIIANSLVQQLSNGVDSAFFGNLASPAPKGLDSLTAFTSSKDGVTLVSAGATITNLDPFAEAISAAEQRGAGITSFVTDPATALKLSQLKVGTSSNQPLLGVDATNGTQRQVLGVPVLVSQFVKAGVVYGLDASKVFSVVRQQVELAKSDQVRFTSDQVGIRAIARVGFAFPVQKTIVRITTTS